MYAYMCVVKREQYRLHRTPGLETYALARTVSIYRYTHNTHNEIKRVRERV